MNVKQEAPGDGSAVPDTLLFYGDKDKPEGIGFLFCLEACIY